MMNKITILGSGTSTGVPILGCKCKVCQSTDPRNKRLRTSALIETIQSKTIIIDTSPDLRSQLLQHKDEKIDGVIITHDHADHTHGMDDLRPFTFKRAKPLEIFTNEATAQQLTQKFAYIFQRQKYFENKAILGGGIPLLDLVTITNEHFPIAGEDFYFYHTPHGHTNSLAMRHGKMAYIVDCQEISAEILTALQKEKLELLIIDCLRYQPHQTHLHLEKTLQYIQAIGPKLAVLTHMAHELDYLELTAQLRQRGINNVFPAIDGQTFHYS
jgi:phosphoribosyl 1,2-cyclic phosphate phosphodiesterase